MRRVLRVIVSLAAAVLLATLMPAGLPALAAHGSELQTRSMSSKVRQDQSHVRNGGLAVGEGTSTSRSVASLPAAAPTTVITAPGNVGSAGSPPATVTAPCGAGQRVIGGGYAAPPLQETYVNASYPLSDGSGWYASFFNVGAPVGYAVTVFAVCEDGPRDLSTISSSPVSVHLNTLASTSATCPVGTQVIAGGFDYPALASMYAPLSRPSADKTKWEGQFVHFNSGVATPPGARTHALCQAQSANTMSIVEAPLSVPYTVLASSTLTCPAGSVVTAGGYDVPKTPLFWIPESHPQSGSLDHLTKMFHYNTGLPAASATAYAVCLSPPPPPPTPPDLSLTKSHTGNFSAGASGTYTIQVTNAASAGPTTGAITVTDTLPTGLSFSPSPPAPAYGAGWNCIAAGQVVTCTNPNVLAPGATSTLTLTVAVAAGASANVTNNVTVATTGETATANNSANDPTIIDPPPGGGPGTLDPTFGTGGRTVVDFGSLESHGTGRALAIQSDGKSVLAGSSNGQVTLLRLLTDGNPDTSFAGDGRVVRDFGGSDAAQGVAIQSDGKIVIVGQGGPGSIDFLVARFNADGSIDTSFDTDGWLTLTFGNGGQEVGQAALIQPDGKILVVGFLAPSLSLAMARLNPDGSLDTTFNGTGTVTTNLGADFLALDAALQADGKIVVSGRRAGTMAVARFNANGSPDNTFDGDGWTTASFGSPTHGQSIQIQADGKIAVGGASDARQFAFARFNANGSLDTSCDGDGTLALRPTGNGQGFSVALQTNGKIVFAGYKDTGDLAVYRLNGADCSLDTGFGMSGLALIDFGSAGLGEFAEKTAIQSDGKILLAGSFNNNGSTTDEFVARLFGDPAGPPPPTFTLTVQKQGPGSGDVTSDVPGISCGADCSEAYTTPTTVILTAQASPGSLVSLWGVGDCDASTPTTCTVNVASNRTVRASFEVAPPQPTSLTVNSTLDAHDAVPGNGVCETVPGNAVCPLRAAVEEANAPGSLVATIHVPAGSYLLSPSLGQILVSPAAASLTIDGASSAGTIIDAQGSPTVTTSRIFQIPAGKTVSITDLTLQNGGPAGSGGAIDMQNATLTLDNVVVANNTAGASGGGGGIRSGGASSVLTIRNSTIRDNRSLRFSGGGIQVTDGTLIVEDSQILNNQGMRGGGGISSVSSAAITTTTILRTTISGNQAFKHPTDTDGNGTGGGIGNSGNVTLTDVVLSNNSTDAGSGGMSIGTTNPALSPVTVNMTRVIVSGNFTTGAANNGGIGAGPNTFVNITDSVISGNSTAGNTGGVGGSGTFNLTNVTVANNSAGGSGGGLIFSGPSTLTNVLVHNNTAGVNSGGLSLSGSPTATNLIIMDNHAGGDGGGLTFGGVGTLTNVTISGNTASGEAGGMRVGGSATASGNANLTNVTISGNTAATNGGGLRVNNTNAPTGTFPGTVTLANVTIANNSAPSGGGISVGNGSAQLKNTLLAAGTGGANCDGGVTSLGGNLSSDMSCAASLTQSSDQNGVNPLLGPLADNGGPPIGAPTGPNYGPSKTHALLAGSPAIDKAITCPPPTTDQRGTARPLEGDAINPAGCDIGAFEAPAVALDTAVPVTSATTTPSAPDGQDGWFVSNVIVELSATDPTPATGVKEIVYSSSGAQTIPSTTVSGSVATIDITAEGTTTLSFFAKDNAGNVETTKTLTIKWDKTPPVPPTIMDPSTDVTVPGAASYTIQGSAEAGTLVRVWVDENQNKLKDPGEAEAGQQQLGAGISAFSVSVPLVRGPNRFTVTASDSAGHESAATPVPLIRSQGPQNVPDLDLQLRNQGAFRQGQPGTYLVTVVNRGQQATNGPIQVTDTLPAGLVFQGAFDTNGAPLACGQAGPTAYRCDVPGALAVGARYEFTMRVLVTAPAGTQLTNTAVVSTPGDTNPANDSATDNVTVR